VAICTGTSIERTITIHAIESGLLCSQRKERLVSTMLMNMKNDDVIAMTCLVRRSHAYDVDLLVAFIYLLEG
jgi:hypothetical protein